MSFPETVHIAIILYEPGRSSNIKLSLKHYTCTLADMLELVDHLKKGKKISDELMEFWNQLPFMEDDIDDIVNAMFRLSQHDINTCTFACAVDGHPVAFASSWSKAAVAIKLFYADLFVKEL